jgi:hypothetical protein
MKPEKSIEIQDIFARDIDRWTHRIISLLAVRHHNVQTIRRAPLKNYHQAFILSAHRLGCISSASQEGRDRSGTDNGKRGVAKKNAAGDGHN